MNKYYNNKGIEYQFNKKKNFDNGAEGKIYLTSNGRKVVKIFNNRNNSKINKIKAMIELRNSLNYQGKVLLDKLIAWPLCLVFDSKKRAVGYEMDYVKGMPLNSFMSKLVLSRHEDYSYYKNVVVANNIANTIAKIHQLLPEVVIGDMSKMNFVVLKNHTIKLIDSDSVQLTYKNKFYKCDMYTSGYISPERAKDKKVRLTQQSDDFILAILLFELLVNNQHPFAIYSSYGGNISRDNAITQGKTCYFGKNKGFIPCGIIKPNQILSRNLYIDFYNTFSKGINSFEFRTSSEDFRNDIYEFINDLEVCKDNKEHYHLKHEKCPFCNHNIRNLYKDGGLSLFEMLIYR